MAEVEIQFAAYERALISSDVITLDRFFLGGATLRCAWQLEKREIVNYGPNCASAATLFGCDSTQSEIGSQSPTWICFPEGWRIVAAISASLTSLER